MPRFTLSGQYTADVSITIDAENEDEAREAWAELTLDQMESNDEDYALTSVQRDGEVS